MSFPGPAELGRGLVVLPGATVPALFADAPRVTIDEAVLASPQVVAAMAAVLHEAWDERRPIVIELGVGLEALRAPEVEGRPPCELDPGFTFERERLQFLVWANTYDARKDGDPIWWHGVRASRLGATLGGPADVLLSDGTPAWCDGGPRRPIQSPEGATGRGENAPTAVDARRAQPVAAHGGPEAPASGGDAAGALASDGVESPAAGGDGAPVVVHRDSIDAGLLTAARLREPQAELAPDQLAAVAHAGGPARIIAPAGSGKTRVLTERIRHLLLDRGHEPQLVTAVAYNVMAAEQLRERTAGFRPTIRTLNSLGLNVCSRRGDWRIAEEPFCREVLSSLVKTTRKVGTDPLAPYLDALATIRLGLVPPEKAEDFHPDAAGIAAAFPAYRDVLHSSGRLDFDEQIYKAVELLLTDPDLRAEVRAEARTLLVDEFQDLTPAHLLLIRLVAGPAADVFGVGDDDQVIYGYAGADPGFLIDYKRYFPGAAAYDLQTNYRCPEAVVDAARTLLGHNYRRIDKTIRAGAVTEKPVESVERETGGLTALDASRTRRLAPADVGLVVRAVTSDDMGPATVELIRQWADEGAVYSDMAVLTRVNSSLLPVQLLLHEAGIPYRAAVGPWILERAGTAAALAYLRIAADPTRITRADLRATVRRPSRKISPKAIDMLARDAVTSLRSIRGLADWLSDKDVFVKDADRVENYAADLEALAQAMSKPGTTTADLLRFVRDTIGLGEAMDTLDASKGALDRSSNGDDLAALLQVAHLHPDAASFEAWLHQVLAAGRGAGGDDGSGSTSPQAGVHLATVHRVKGREWPRVVVFGADAGLFPHRLSIDVEEERRIFHVGITRAKEQAVVLADSAGPSPFVEELHRPAPPRPAVDRNDPNPFRKLTMPPAPAQTTRTGKAAKAKPKTNGEPGFAAAPGYEITLAGGLKATIKEIRRGEALVETNTGSTVVSFGSAIRANGENVRLVAPPERVDAAVAALKAWRTALAKQEGKPPYVYLSDAHISDIAERDPDTLDRLARCKGIGPGKLDAYGETLLALLDEL